MCCSILSISFSTRARVFADVNYTWDRISKLFWTCWSPPRWWRCRRCRCCCRFRSSKSFVVTKLFYRQWRGGKLRLFVLKKNAPSKLRVRPKTNIIKHLRAVIYKCSWYKREFVPDKLFQPSQMFKGTAEPPASPANIRPGWKGLLGTNTLDYYEP
jgi:hypothetical protein